MGNSQLPNEGLQLKNPSSPKLLVSGNMSQSKTTTGSPKSPKSPDDSSKSDGVSSSPSKSGRSPPNKSSAGNKSLSVAERLVLSTKSKTSSTLKSPASKSPPSSPNTSVSSKSEVSKEPTKDQCLKSDETKTNNDSNSSIDINVENTPISNEKDSVIIENGTCKLNENKQQDDNIESFEIEINQNDLSEEKEKENETKCDSNDEVVVIESLDNLHKPLRLDDSVILELTSKKDIRQKIWEFMEENSLVVFPKPCFNRIPNFKGCITATHMLEKLEEFKKSKTVQVTPDKAQETARFLTLNWGKRLLVPLLRLKEGLLQNVSLPFTEPSVKMLKSASTQKGLRKWGTKLITLDHNNEGHHIDMIILGSVAVDKKGHRIGIGNGFCDLEFVILRSMNMVTDNTIVVTIVHDAQVFDTLQTDLFKPYDVPVDIIITPTDIIRIEARLDRPKDVFWKYISKRRLLEMPPLQLLRTRQEKDSNFDCTLKDVDSEPEEIPPSPKTFKKSKGFRQRRSYSARSEANDSVFKDGEVSKRRSVSKQSLQKDTKAKHKRTKSTSSQQQRSSSTVRNNNQNDQKDHRSTSKKPNKRRTKSESTKNLTSSVTENGVQAAVSPLNDSLKNKRRSRQKPRQRVHSDDVDNQPVLQSNINDNTKHVPRLTRRDYIERQEQRAREVSTGHHGHTEYIHSPKKYYSQTRRFSSYSQDRSTYGTIRSNSRVQQRDSNRSVILQHNRYSNGPTVRQTRYFNGPVLRHNSFNEPATRQNGSNNYVARHNSFSNDQYNRQNNAYEGIISRHNNFSKGPTIRQDGYTNSRIFRPPHYHNGVTSHTDERNYVRESRPRFNNRPGYFNSQEKHNYSRSINGDEFVLKVGNIANNVRVRDLKAALMERGVKPLHITWRGPRGFAYLRYNNSTDLNKDNVMGSLQNVRINPNGVETAQTQTLIVTECQFS